MTDASISEMTFTMMSLLFLLLGVVLIASIIMSTINPYEQIVFANAEKLRASIEQACSTGGEVAINLDLPQNTPVATGLFSVMPIWMISTSGDPNYVLYYESFPVGEATGWEIYQTMQNRIVTYLPAGHADDNYDAVRAYAQSVALKAKEKNVGLVEGVILNNIVLDDKYRSDFYLGEKPDLSNPSGSTVGTQADANIKKYGEWKTGEGSNVFRFNNYAGLTTFEKSAAKYATCGEHSLCLKTRDGVYRFPLTQCNDIKSVQLVYKALGDDEKLETRVGQIFGKPGGTVAGTSFFNGFLRGLNWFKTLTSRVSFLVIGTVTWTIADLGTNMIKRHLAFKVSDFNMASPCGVDNAIIKKVGCKMAQPAIPGYYDDDFKVCESVIQYPIYKYSSDGTLVDTKATHYACIESMGSGIDGVPASTFSDADQCIQIEIQTLKDDYCWTPNPYKVTNDAWWDKFLHNDIIKESVLVWFDPPIHTNTAYITGGQDVNEMMILKPTDIALKKGEDFKGALGRKWWWGWP